MKKLYSFLAFLMFACFIFITASLILNKQIDKTVVAAKAKIDEITVNFNNSLENAELYHNLYLVNCFPNVCAKVSFAKFKETTTLVDPVTKLETVKKDVIEAGSTEYLVIKYSPLLGKIFVEGKPNNIIVNKNGEKFATFYYSGLNYEASADLVSYYKSLSDTNKTASDLLNFMSWNSELNIDRFKASVEEARLRADKVKIAVSSYDVKEETSSSSADIALDALVINNKPEILDIHYKMDIKNFANSVVLESAKLSKQDWIAKLEKAENQEEVEKEAMAEFLNYASVLVQAVKDFDTYKTSIELPLVHIQEYEMKDGKQEVNSMVHGSASLTLDKNLDPKGFVNVMVKTQDDELKALMEGAVVPNPKAQMGQQADAATAEASPLYIKDEKGNYVAKLTMQDGKIVFNSKDEIDVKGVVKSALDFAAGMIGMLKMGMMK